MTTERTTGLAAVWMHLYDVTNHDAARYRLAWRSAWQGRQLATVDCMYLRRRLIRALDTIDALMVTVNKLRAEHRLSAMAVDPDGDTTRYCLCGPGGMGPSGPSGWLFSR